MKRTGVFGPSTGLSAICGEEFDERFVDTRGLKRRRTLPRNRGRPKRMNYLIAAVFTFVAWVLVEKMKEPRS